MQTADNSQGIYAILEQLAYTWKDGSKEAKPVPDKVRQMPDMKVLKNPLTKPNIQIIEEGNSVVIDFPDFTTTIQSKKP